MAGLCGICRDMYPTRLEEGQREVKMESYDVGNNASVDTSHIRDEIILR